MDPSIDFSSIFWMKSDDVVEISALKYVGLRMHDNDTKNMHKCSKIVFLK